jgi:ribose transport system permease protein
VTDPALTSEHRASDSSNADRGDPPARTTPARAPRSAIWRAMSFRNASAVYVFVVIFVVFALWIPDTFLDGTTWRTLLDEPSVTALLAVGLILPLSAGVFDLSIGTALGFGMIFVSWLLSKEDLPIVPAVVVALAAGALIGTFNGLLVVRVRIDSFIATLGVSSVLLAMTAWISGGQQILGLNQTFQDLTTSELFGVSVPVYLMLVLALIVWYVLERTPTGRRVYATGGNIDAARLAGVRTSAVIVASLAVCSVIAVLAGMVVASRVGAGDPTTGPSYLLPAFSAAFLGSTQFRGGRFNVLGTVVAVYVLATGVKGLQLAGAPVWIPDLFNGAALLIAVGMAKYQRSPAAASGIRRLIGQRRATAA